MSELAEPGRPAVFPAGDRAVCIELGDTISVEINARVRTLEYLIQQKGVAGVVECVPTFRSLLVYYDPRLTDYETLVATIEALSVQASGVALPPARQVELPCCYDPELGPDLQAAAERLALPADEVIRLHASATYHLYFIGFTPGLPYMTGMPERLHLPRLATPRTKVPPGSVGIGGIQCCIYSVESPGGYWILGRTPLALYDPQAAEPVLLRAGDRVHFRPIDRGEFDTIAASVAGLTYRPRIW
ncbi:MAG: 5-oxoprolinase subunit PxpB [Candidatus Rokuibacteriota bacterium]